MTLLNHHIIKLLSKAGVTGEIELTKPPKPEMGDLAFACFGIAKEGGKNPDEAAKRLVERTKGLKDCKIIERVVAMGPYVNFYLSAGEAAEIVIGEVSKKNFGANDLGSGRSVLLEYPSNNTHKELHIGHLRNISIGNALVKLFEKSGYKTIPVNYINDFGVHVAKCLWWILRSRKSIKSESRKSVFNRQKWLGEMYAEASRHLDSHPDEKEKVSDLQKRLEARDKTVWGLFKRTRKWSLDGFEKIFKELGVKHRKTFYEKDVKETGQKLVDELLKNRVAQKGEGGAIIVDLRQFNLDVGLLRKSSGVGLYMTSDLGLAVVKDKTYPRVSESIYITGAEQIFYFKQLFKILELAGYHYKMTHVPYGLITRPEGKMSSRMGNVILFEDLRDEVYRKVLQETTNRHPDWPGKKVEQTAEILTLAAIKFEFLKHEALKNIVFDAKAATSFDGFTGPYVLYTVARINSILRKSRVLKVHKVLDRLTMGEEKKLVLMLGEYGEIVKKAMENYNPSVVVKYCFDVAQSFNDFYTKHSVLNTKDEQLTVARLALCDAVKRVIVSALGLLTISTVEEM